MMKTKINMKKTEGRSLQAAVAPINTCQQCDRDQCGVSQAHSLFASLSESEDRMSDCRGEYSENDRTANKRRKCSQCDKTVGAKTDRRRHMMIHTREKTFNCSDCGKNFSQMGHLNSHTRTHTGEKPFACSFFGKRFTQKGHLGKHTRTHTGEKPFACSVCGKGFSVNRSLLRHTRVHVREKPLTGSLCHFIPGVEDLHPEQHVWSDTGEQHNQHFPHVKEEAPDPSSMTKEEEKEYITTLPLNFASLESDDEDKCQNEDNRGADPSSSSSSQHRAIAGDGDHGGRSQADNLFAPLSDHDNITSHSPDTDDDNEPSSHDVTCQSDGKHWKCCQCGKTLSSRSALKVHMRTHSGEKPFACSYCGKRFAHKEQLGRHTRTHTGEKPFACTVCSKCFALKTGLIRHTRIHSGEKPFVCSICSKRFTMKIDLRRHTRTHTAEKPFGCSFCNKRFTQKGHLETHKNTHWRETIRLLSLNLPFH